jgi:hypothetical protein
MIVANIIPIAGVLWYDWDAAIIMSLYWTETLIIGFYALLRIISAPLKRISLKKRLGGICFFLLFFGWFCSGHGVAVVFLFFIYPHMKSDASWIPPAVPEDIYKPSWPGPLALYELGTDTIKLLYYLLPRTAIIMILSLIFSHGISFVLDYLIKGNRNTANLRELIAEPFARVIILHISVMIGGFVICVFKTNVVVLICLLLFKCCLDVSMYIRRQIKKVPNDEIEMLDGQRPK